MLRAMRTVRCSIAGDGLNAVLATAEQCVDHTGALLAGRVHDDDCGLSCDCHVRR